jgi:uncharacterized membrane protein
MDLSKVTENAVVTGSDRGKSAANMDYILYIVGFFIPLVALVGVIMAYINRGDASDIYRTHFNFQIRLFWRGILFWVAGAVSYIIAFFLAAVTAGLGFILMIVPVALGLWWLVSTILMIARGMKALGNGRPI